MDNTPQTALVTGANKGIGLETARQLAQQGFTVWMGARDRARGEAALADLAGAGDVRLVDLDITDPDSVRDAAARIGAGTGGLDVLVNNAGVAVEEGEGPPGTVRPETIRRALDVNLFGTLEVTQQLLPLIRRSPAGRIVNVSTTMGSIASRVAPGDPLGTFPPAFAYASSKTMVNALTAWLATELDGTPVKVNAVCPGFNATDMNHHTGTQHPSEGAKVVVRAATLPDDGPTGSFFDAAGPVAW